MLLRIVAKEFAVLDDFENGVCKINENF